MTTDDNTPSPTEIAVACEAIRRTWSADERRRRRFGLTPGRRKARGDVLPPAWQPPLIAVSAEVAAALGVR